MVLGTCQFYGHGQLKCGNEFEIRKLSRGENRTTVQNPCTVPNCAYAWSHTTDAHHCSRCGQRGACSCGNVAQSVVKQCPLCKEMSSIDLSHEIFTGTDCIICCESGPSCYFYGMSPRQHLRLVRGQTSLACVHKAMVQECSAECDLGLAGWVTVD